MTGETFDKYRQTAIVAAAILGCLAAAGVVLYFIYLIRGALVPFLYAAVIVYLARPFVELLAARRVNRMLAVSVAYMIVFLLITVFVLVFVPIIINQINQLIDVLPDGIELGVKYLADLRIPAELDGILSELKETAGRMAVNIAANLPGTAIGLFGGLFNIILGWLLAFYILKDMPAIKETVIELAPEKYRQNTIDIIREVNFAVGGYIRGQIIVSLAVGFLVTVWLLILGVDFALLLGLLAGVLNVIPYFGAIVGGGLAVVVAMFDSTEQAIAVIIGIAIIQQLDAVIISPAVLRHTVNLHPTVIVFSLLLGAVLFGFIGLVFAIPIAAATKAILLHYVFARPVTAGEEI